MTDKAVVIIPALNEENNIGLVVSKALEYSDVIVVSDGSTDNTAEVARQFGAIVVNLKDNIGIDGATFTGLERALNLGYEIGVTLDADGQHDPKFLENMITPIALKQVVMVHGVRPKFPRFSEKIMCFYAKNIYGISDILCGYKAYSLKCVYEPNKLMKMHKSYTSALPWCVADAGLPFVEVQIPISSRPPGDPPRVGGTLMANLRILSALLLLVKFDVMSLFQNPKRFFKNRFSGKKRNKS